LLDHLVGGGEQCTSLDLRPTPRLAYEYVRIPVELTSLKPEAARKSIPGTDQPQPKTLGAIISLAQATHVMK
jgi:hypothetical protein